MLLSLLPCPFCLAVFITKVADLGRMLPFLALLLGPLLKLTGGLMVFADIEVFGRREANGT